MGEPLSYICFVRHQAGALVAAHLPRPPGKSMVSRFSFFWRLYCFSWTVFPVRLFRFPFLGKKKMRLAPGELSHLIINFARCQIFSKKA
jgi:hypothetical protein